MTPLQELALIRCGLDRTFVAWYLVRRVGKVGTWNDLATSLGLTIDKLVSLALCKAPRQNFREEDIHVVAAYVGISDAALADLIGNMR